MPYDKMGWHPTVRAKSGKNRKVTLMERFWYRMPLRQSDVKRMFFVSVTQRISPSYCYRNYRRNRNAILRLRSSGYLFALKPARP